MQRVFSKPSAVLATAAICLACATGCGEEARVEPVAASMTFDVALLDSSWPVMVAHPSVLDGLVAEPGWQAYYGRDYKSALEAFKDDPILAARIHSEIAAVYRNALDVQIGSIIETYKPEEHREGDPSEVAYLLGVSYMMSGDVESAQSLLGQMSGSTVEMVIANDANWSAVVTSGVDLTGGNLPNMSHLGAVEVGSMPSPVITAPHFQLPETLGDRTVAATDPTVLAELAYWHESAAALAEGNGALHGAVWGVTSEETGGEVTLSDLFLGPWMNAADLSFVADIGSGITVDELFLAHDASIIAIALHECVTPESVSVDCVQAQAATTRSAILNRMNETAGVESADYRDLAKLSEVGIIRAAIRMSDMVGDERSSGLLRIGALESERPPTLSPIFQLSMAAWDVGNRNPRRASELLHVHEGRLPSLDSARYSLDALNLRVSRDAGAGLPMH